MTAIVDRDGLAELIRVKVQRRFDGNLSAASRASGITQPTLYALSLGRRELLRPDTVGALRRWLWLEIDELRRCLFSPAASRILEAHEARAEDYWTAYLSRGVRGRIDKKTVNRRAKDYRDLRAYLNENLRSYCTQFEQRVRSLGHDDKRLEIAYFDMLVGLLDDAAGQVERHWTELSDDELRRYIDWGTRRELIRLQRSPAAPRAQERAAEGVDIRRPARKVNEIARLSGSRRRAK